MTDEQKQSGLEGTKVAIDVMKFLATLSTGTIVFIFGFYGKEKLFTGATSYLATWMGRSLSFSLLYLFLVGLLNFNSKSWWTRVLAGCAFFCFVAGATYLQGYVAGYFGAQNR
jgi:hypothetical protein